MVGHRSLHNTEIGFGKIFHPICWAIGVSTLLVGMVNLEVVSAGQNTQYELTANLLKQRKHNQKLDILDKKNQWFFSNATAKSIWEIALYAEKISLSAEPNRVEELNNMYTSLIDIESDISIKRKEISENYGITDDLMLKPNLKLTPEQQIRFDTYMNEVRVLHKKAVEIISEDELLKAVFDQIATFNGLAVFWDRFEEYVFENQCHFSKCQIY